MIAAAAAHRFVVTAEDGIAAGGIGSAIADAIGAIRPEVPVDVLGTPNRFIPHGEAHHILARLGLDADGIAARLRERLAEPHPAEPHPA
jgi:1-deoxy-D-xylulose-5-phosphate synthase